MPDVHRLGDVRRTEVDDDGARLRSFGEKQMLAARGGRDRFTHGCRRESKIQEARAGDFHLLANVLNVEFGEHVGRKLARIHLSLFGQRHERVGLVVTELWVGAGAHKHGGKVCVRQNRYDRVAQTLFEKQMDH